VKFINFGEYIIISITSSTVVGIKEEIWEFIYGSYTHDRGEPLLDDEHMAYLSDRGANE